MSNVIEFGIQKTINSEEFEHIFNSSEDIKQSFYVVIKSTPEFRGTAEEYEDDDRCNEGTLYVETTFSRLKVEFELDFKADKFGDYEITDTWFYLNFHTEERDQIDQFFSENKHWWYGSDGEDIAPFEIIKEIKKSIIEFNKRECE